MKKRTFIITIIIIAIVIIAIAAGIVVMQQMLNQKKQTNANESNVQNTNIESNINEIESNNTTNTPNENLTPIDENIVSEPITKPTTTENYYYSQLDTYGKSIYNKLQKEKDKLKTGTYVFNFGTSFNTLLHSENGEETLNTAFQSAWNAFSYDQNDLFYIDINKINLIKESRSLGGITTYYISIGPVNSGNYLQNDFQNQETIEKAEKYINNITKQIKEQTKNDTNIQKVKKVHDWLVSVIEYDQSEEEKSNKYNIYGALHDKKAVCEGYARSFKYIMEQIGVPCVLVAGTAQNTTGNTEVHAWDYVQIDENWYAIDVTWDDPIINGDQTLSEDQKYKYFLKGSEEFFKNHTENGTLSENSIKFTYPKLSTNNYNIQ